MIPIVALGTFLSTAQADTEFEAIRNHYRALPRFAYTAVTYVKGNNDGVRAEGIYLGTKGARLTGTRRERSVDTEFSTWGTGKDHYVWVRKVSRHGILPNGPERVDESRLSVFDSAEMAWSNLEGPTVDIPLCWQVYPHRHLGRESGLRDVRRMERLPDVRHGNRLLREIALCDDNARMRAIFTYDPVSYDLAEIRHEALIDGQYALVDRTRFRFFTPTNQTRVSYHPRPAPAPPSWKLGSPSKPKPDRLRPNDGRTLAEIEKRLIERYGQLQTLRSRIDSSEGTPFAIEFAWDRAVGHRLARTERFRKVELVGQGPRGTTWQAHTDAGQFRTEVRQYVEPGYWLDPGSLLAWQAWNKRPLNLASERWNLRFDLWQDRPMQVLSRTRERTDWDRSGTRQRHRILGEEEIWIDTTSGLIVRSRSRGDVTFDATHFPQPNVPLTAEDLRFRPPTVDGFKMLAAWRQEVRRKQAITE